MHHFPLLIKPASDDCDLSCSYCHYKGKVKNHGRMSKDTLRQLVKNYESCVEKPTYEWQGGEPTLMGLNFFAYAQTLQGSCAINTLQTNGMSIDESWGSFLAKNNWVVGLSYDGQNNSLRGGGFVTNKVENTAALLNHHGIPFNILCTVTDTNIQSPELTLDEILLLEPKGIQFIPQKPIITNFGYGELESFFKALYLHMIRKHRGTNILNFYNSYMSWNSTPTICEQLGECGIYMVVEADGSVYPCDFFVKDEWLLGNIHTDSLADMFDSERMQDFRELKTIPSEGCGDCGVKKACNMGCPADRDYGNDNKFEWEKLPKTPMCDTNTFIAEITKP